MRKWIKKLKTLARIVRRDGLIRGVGNYAALLGSGDGRTKTLRIAEYPSRIKFRENTSDVHLVLSILYAQEYSIDTRGVDPAVIIDVGSNAGYASVFFANKYPSSEVFSFEPEKSNYEILAYNTEQYPNVKIQNAAIWGENKDLIPEYENADAWSFSLREPNDTDGPDIESIPGVTFETVLNTISAPAIDILKIDIEGAEKSLFSGNCDWLKKVKIIVIELHDRKLKGCSHALYKALIEQDIFFTQKNMGYNTVIYNEAYF